MRSGPLLNTKCGLLTFSSAARERVRKGYLKLAGLFFWFLAILIDHSFLPAAVSHSDFMCRDQGEMGTPFKICLYVDHDKILNVQNDFEQAFRQIRAMDDWMSEWRSETMLSKINQAAGVKPVKIGPNLFQLLQFSLEVSQKTHGAFDPTFNALWGLYNFKEGHYREPTDSELQTKLPLINFRLVKLDKKQQTAYLMKPGMRLGLGGLGQGYAVDKIADWLKARGYPAGFVDGSGDTYFWGKKPDGSLWKIGVRDPRDNTKLVGSIYGTDFAVTTCGDDNKYFMVGQRRVHHVIDPKSGRPAQGVRQVTVIARRALIADAYDTATFVLGLEQGEKVLAAQKLNGVFVTDNAVSATQGLKLRRTNWGNIWELDP